VSVATPRPLLQNLVDADVVDESNVFGGTGDDNDDFLLSLINTDLPSEDLDLGVWKLLAVTALSFANVAVLLGYLIQAAR
jgi:hypothetical protein